ncbi:hypothetical protein GOP47_0027833 [Adiantum capillus-veneris]|nr:hypothetical protein GOP47_0027833 [Adiantum capillus-veneris]
MEFNVSQIWSLMGAIALLQTFIPFQLRRLFDTQFESWCGKLSRAFNRYTFIEVHEDVQGSFKTNLVYREVELYLSSLERMHESDYVRVHRCADKSRLIFTLPPEETIEDSFMGAELWWTHHCQQKQESNQQQTFWDYRGRRESNKESRSFSLKMLRADKVRILAAYFEHISGVAKEIERRNTQRKLHTNDGCDWEQVDFKHPSTFDSVALSPELKEHIKADLQAFAHGEAFYHRVGRAWKRGYLLYGPPGTGKSSLIAAIANFLNYDIYDLELTGVTDNSELKSLLIRTSRKSIIVIEDIDCSLDLSDRIKKVEPTNSSKEGANSEASIVEQKNSKVTLSGLLNFTDGLWSCCGEERIFIFTTNHKERLDPALLRSGRMDLHIFLSYCTFSAFKVLAANYLGVHEHDLYPNVEKAMQDSRVTPAEVVELLLSNKESVQVALERVMAALSEASKSREDQLSSSDLDKVRDMAPLKLESSSNGDVKPSLASECINGDTKPVANGKSDVKMVKGELGSSNGDEKLASKSKRTRKMKLLLMRLSQVE